MKEILHEIGKDLEFSLHIDLKRKDVESSFAIRFPPTHLL